MGDLVIEGEGPAYYPYHLDDECEYVLRRDLHDWGLDNGRKVCEDAQMPSTELVTQNREHWDYDPPPLTFSENYYKHRRAIHYWFSLLAMIAVTVTLGITAESDDDAEGVLATIMGVANILYLVAGLVMGIDGLLDRKVNNGAIASSRGVRYRREQLEAVPIGDEVIVSHTVRTGERPLLWPVFGRSPSSETQVGRFDATTDEGQEKARDFVEEIRKKALPAEASVEAKALAKTLKS